jgi:hypothetical protein
MGSSASVWLLNVAIFLGALFLGGVRREVIRKTQVAARLRQLVHLGEPSSVLCLLCSGVNARAG